MISSLNSAKPIVNSSVLPVLNFLTEKQTDHITIKNDEIISLIRKINPGKATGFRWDIWANATFM